MRQRLVPVWFARRRFAPLWPCLVLCGVFAALGLACLPDDPPVNARLLRAGSDINNPTFVTIDGDPWILYEENRLLPKPNRGGVVDLSLVKWSDGSQQRLLLGGRAERPEWPLLVDASGARFYVTDERLSPGGLPVGNLHRVSLGEGIKETVSDVLTYALGGSGRTFYYRKYVATSPLAELHLRDLDGRDRNLGLVAPGQIHLVGDETLYFIVGADRVLTRTTGFDGAPESLRARVSQFQIGGGEKFALLTVADEGRPRTIVVDFVTKEERALPVDNPCCWLGFGGSTFTFADSAKPGQPAVLHSFDFISGVDRTLTMPDGLNDIVSIVGRKDSNESLFFDTRGNMALLRPNVSPTPQLLPLRPRSYRFSDDGRFFFYMVIDPPPPPPAVVNYPSGRLFVQNANDWNEPPRQLSPTGASVPVEPRGYQLGGPPPYPLIFWARYGLGTSDLYLGDYEKGTSMLVARGIGEIQVGSSRVLGVVNMSQDLTGELIFRDFIADKQIVIERGVFEVEYLDKSDKIVFTIRERMSSSPRNGLWASMTPPLDALDHLARVAPRLKLDLVDQRAEGGAGQRWLLEARTW